jgi:hypothetical protein
VDICHLEDQVSHTLLFLFLPLALHISEILPLPPLVLRSEPLSSGPVVHYLSPRPMSELLTPNKLWSTMTTLEPKVNVTYKDCSGVKTLQSFHSTKHITT